MREDIRKRMHSITSSVKNSMEKQIANLVWSIARTSKEMPIADSIWPWRRGRTVRSQVAMQLREETSNVHNVS